MTTEVITVTCHSTASAYSDLDFECGSTKFSLSKPYSNTHFETDAKDLEDPDTFIGLSIRGTQIRALRLDGGSMCLYRCYFDKKEDEISYFEPFGGVSIPICLLQEPCYNLKLFVRSKPKTDVYVTLHYGKISQAKKEEYMEAIRNWIGFPVPYDERNLERIAKLSFHCSWSYAVDYHPKESREKPVIQSVPKAKPVPYKGIFTRTSQPAQTESDDDNFEDADDRGFFGKLKEWLAYVFFLRRLKKTDPDWYNMLMKLEGRAPKKV